MDFKKLLYNLTVTALILSTAAYVFGSLTFPKDVFYLLVMYMLFGAVVLAHGHLLDFLTVKKVFITQFLVIALMVMILMFAFDASMPGFSIGEFTLAPIDTELLTVKQYTMPKYGTILAVSCFVALIFSFLEWLRTSE